MEDGEPAGLGMSLDDLISKQKTAGGKSKEPSQRAKQERGGKRRSGRGGGQQQREYQQQQQFQQPYRQQQQQAWHPYTHPSQQQWLPFPQQQLLRQPVLQQQHSRKPQQPQQLQQPKGPEGYRKEQQCNLEEGSGDVVVRYQGAEIVRVSPAGDVQLSAEGQYEAGTLASLNDALGPLGLRVTAVGGDVESGVWSVADGKSLVRFHDGVVLPAKGAAQATRGQQVLQAFANPAWAAAAQASNAAAAKAGLLPPAGAVQKGASVFARLSAGGDSDTVRRLKAQGRYAPY